MTAAQSTPPARRRHRRALLVALAAVLGVAAVAGLIFAFFRLSDAGLRESELAMTDFLRHSSVGEADAAYQLLSSDAKRGTTYEKFSKVEQEELLAHRDFVSAKVVSRKYSAKWRLRLPYFGDIRTETASYAATVRYGDGKESHVDAVLVKEDGAWKIRKITVAGSSVP